ncbi:hypothetical protein DL767_004885 [Monosporascus sp. MG133]|nr:hypothetical protein DL767_004885 [Monosporascus sp. MG133]
MSDKSSNLAPHCSTSSTAAAAAATATVPWPGNTFAIRERATGRAITLIDGKLRLKDWDYAGDRGAHWVCEGNDGWLGFRNPVSGTYIGHDDRGGFWAKATAHKQWEYFCATRHPAGGYLLLKRRGDALWKMDVATDGSKFYETAGEGTVWEFFKLRSGQS